MAFHMLCGFAVELYLKAFLIHKGHSETELRQRHIGHDLAQLRDKCRREGLLDTAADQLVELLAEKHSNFEYRYMKRTSEYRTMDLRAIFFAFTCLDRAVDTSIGASAARGKAPGCGWKFASDGPWRLPLF
jgi:uncharacterized membrane-anchored protein YjiN (DUF445 family)